MRALVTGGAGFIGSALVRALAKNGVPVACLDALTYAGNRENLSEISEMPDFELLEADIRDVAAVGNLLRAFRPTVVFHLAAETHVDRSIDDPARSFETNIVGTYALLSEVTAFWRTLNDAEAEEFRYLQVSTDEVFGSAGANEDFVETTRYAPNSPYAASKASADYLVRTWAMAFGLPVLIGHGANTYGPYQFPEKLIPLMTLNAIEGRNLPIYGDGTQVRDWIHVDDHVAGLRAIAERGRVGESYIVSARNPLTNLDVVRGVCQALDAIGDADVDHAELIEHVADRPAHDQRYVSDPIKIESELDWHPTVSFQEGLVRTVTWYLENTDWWEQTRDRYDRIRLGLGQAAQ